MLIHILECVSYRTVLFWLKLVYICLCSTVDLQNLHRRFDAQCILTLTHTHARTHTHTCFTALCPGLPGWAGIRKVKPIWILLKQDTVSGSGISWAICKSASRSRQITMPAPHHSSLFTGWMPFLPPNQQHQSTDILTLSQLKTLIQMADLFYFDPQDSNGLHELNRATLFYLCE